MADRLAELRWALAAAQAKSGRAAEARYRLPAGSSRARVTAANARWMRAAEERDRIQREIDLLETEAASDPKGGDVRHWGLVPRLQAEALCGSLSSERCTAVRLVTCRYCQNIIDRHLHQTPPFDGTNNERTETMPQSEIDQTQVQTNQAAPAPEHIMQFFAYQHLPAHLQEHSQPFADLAANLVANLPRNPERTVALRKLLEAKDAAVRAALAK